MTKLSATDVLLIDNDGSTILLREVFEDVAKANNTTVKTIVKIFFKHVLKWNHIKLMIDLDIENNGIHLNETLQIDPEQIIIPLGCLAENSYGDVLSDNEIEYNASKKKVWKHRYETDKYCIDIPLGQYYFDKFLIKQFLIENHLFVPSWWYPKPKKEGRDDEMIDSKYRSIKDAQEIWKQACKHGDVILKTTEMATLLFNKLEVEGKKRPTDVTKVAEWLRDAAKNNDLVIPPEARRGGRPIK